MAKIASRVADISWALFVGRTVLYRGERVTSVLFNGSSCIGYRRENGREVPFQATLNLEQVEVR